MRQMVGCFSSNKSTVSILKLKKMQLTAVETSVLIFIVLVSLGFCQEGLKPLTTHEKRETVARCTNCRVKGQVYTGHSRFQYDEDCSRYHCICRCNGSWDCPTQNIQQLCQPKLTSTSKRTENTSYVSAASRYYTATSYNSINTNYTISPSVTQLPSPSLPRNCKVCEVNYQQHQSSAHFSYTIGCVTHDDCFCHCNGTWTCSRNITHDGCPGENSRDFSPHSSNHGKSLKRRCSNCLAFGKYFKGDNYFDVRDGCVRYRKCICRCDGSWDCNRRLARNYCNNVNASTSVVGNKVIDTIKGTNLTQNDSSTLQGESECSFCDTGYKVVPGNSFFDVVMECTEYTNCLCRCDGTWECQPHLARQVCPESNGASAQNPESQLVCATCLAKGKIIQANTEFELIEGCQRYTVCRCYCDGSWNCSDQKVENVCSDKNQMEGSDSCSMCRLEDGSLHLPKSKFVVREDCVEHACECFCNGSFSCSDSDTRWVCSDRCSQCDIAGRLIPNNTQFMHADGCLEYSCVCHCNGTYSCSGTALRGICQNLDDLSIGCHQCNVSSTEVYDGESDFVLEQDCIHYRCRCNCDGSYFCSGKDARNVCRGEHLGGCRACLISEYEIYTGGTNFMIRRGCIFYECSCQCDGQWQCPTEKARNVCLGEYPGGCRVCRVSESNVYTYRSSFNLRQGCISYQCKCNCDGSWSCPGKDARNACRGEIVGGCRSCVISEDEFHTPSSSFEIVVNCLRYKCKCNCDGSYACPGETASRTCENGAPNESLVCKSCKVSEKEIFSGNAVFNVDRDCFRYQCKCNCDGSYVCQPESVVDLCSAQPHSAATRKCKHCRMHTGIFPGNSEFKFNSGCYQFSCSCDCSGKWSCNVNNFTNICHEREKKVYPATRFVKSSAMNNITDLKASASSLLTGIATFSGSTFEETSIYVHSAIRGNTEYNQQARNGTDADMVGSNCIPCRADGKLYGIQDEFNLTRGCLRYSKCSCWCSGRWRCIEVYNLCEVSTSSP